MAASDPDRSVALRAPERAELRCTLWFGVKRRRTRAGAVIFAA